MSKVKNYSRQIIVLFIVIATAFTCIHAFIPEAEASAAQYKWRVTHTLVQGSSHTEGCYIRLYYRTNNGAGTEEYVELEGDTDAFDRNCDGNYYWISDSSVSATGKRTIINTSVPSNALPTRVYTYVCCVDPGTGSYQEFKWISTLEVFDQDGKCIASVTSGEKVIPSSSETQTLTSDISISNDLIPNVETFPDGYDPLLDKYSFTNPSHVVESKIYKTVYGTVKGSWLSFLLENGKAHGLCYGMASTTAALLQNRSTINSFTLLSPDKNLGNVEFISNIFESGYSSVLNMDALTFIKYGYVYQFASERDSSINNLRNLYSVVKSYVDRNGSCVVISIYHGTKNSRKHGHTILATGIKETNNEYIILIDDSNFLEQTELSISKDFSTWSYSVDGAKLSDGTPYNYNSSNGIIAYGIPGNVVYNLGLLAGAKTRTATNYLNENRLLVTSTSSLVENDNLSEIFVTEESDLATKDSLKLYWIAEDMNGIELSAENNNSEITVSDVNSSVSVVLDSKENASFYVDDDKTNRVSYLSEKDENASVVFSSVDEKGEIVKTTLTGTANGDKVTATETEDGIQVTGLNDITVIYETADGTAETKAKVDDGSTVNITVNDDENTVETDWQCKHLDDNHDGICDSCSEDFTKSCDCMCHSNAFMQFLHKIICFVYRLFGMNEYQFCGCGKSHW